MIVTGDPESIIKLNFFLFIFPRNMNGSDPLPSMPSTYCSSSSISSPSSDSSSTQFARRGDCLYPLCCFCGFLHTLQKWPMTPHLLHFLPFAGHTFKCSMEKFSTPQHRQSFFFAIAHTGLLFIVILLSPYSFCRNVPSS